MMNRPKVSVCIPVYKSEAYLEQCAGSLFSQTLEDMEFIFVDDGTPDNSIDVIRKTLEKYPDRKNQVKFVVHEKNRGLAGARKTGLLNASGQYTIHCDPDDWVEPQMMASLAGLLDNSSADVAWCGYFRGYPDHQEVEDLPNPPDSMPEIIKTVLNGNLHAAQWNKMYRREISVDKLASYDYPDSTLFFEDYRLAIQMLLNCKSVVFLHTPLYHYRFNNQSISNGGISERNRRCQLALLDTLLLFEKILPQQLYGETLRKVERRVLWDGYFQQFIPKDEWGKLWQKAKQEIWQDKAFSLKRKLMFAALCHFYTPFDLFWKSYKRLFK